MLRPVIVMYRSAKKAILIFLLSAILLAPLLEVFDQSQDLGQDKDLVLVVVFVSMSIGIFTLCKRTIVLLFRLLFAVSVPTYIFDRIAYRSIQIDASPPECLMTLTSLRI